MRLGRPGSSTPQRLVISTMRHANSCAYKCNSHRVAKSSTTTAMPFSNIKANHQSQDSVKFKATLQRHDRLRSCSTQTKLSLLQHHSHSIEIFLLPREAYQVSRQNLVALHRAPSEIEVSDVIEMPCSMTTKLEHQMRTINAVRLSSLA